jgi:hypothetical protein
MEFGDPHLIPSKDFFLSSVWRPEGHFGLAARLINTADAASNAVQMVDPNEINEIDRAASVESSWLNNFLWALGVELQQAVRRWSVYVPLPCFFIASADAVAPNFRLGEQVARTHQRSAAERL